MVLFSRGRFRPSADGQRCLVQLKPDPTATISLSDGRTLGYATWGDPTAFLSSAFMVEYKKNKSPILKSTVIRELFAEEHAKLHR